MILSIKWGLKKLTRFSHLRYYLPTSYKTQNWRFVHVVDRELRKRIRAASWNQAPVTDALRLLILCANLTVWEKTLPDTGKMLQRSQDYIVPANLKSYNSQDRLCYIRPYSKVLQRAIVTVSVYMLATIARFRKQRKACLNRINF